MGPGPKTSGNTGSKSQPPVGRAEDTRGTPAELRSRHGNLRGYRPEPTAIAEQALQEHKMTDESDTQESETFDDVLADMMNLPMDQRVSSLEVAVHKQLDIRLAQVEHNMQILTVNVNALLGADDAPKNQKARRYSMSQ